MGDTPPGRALTRDEYNSLQTLAQHVDLIGDARDALLDGLPKGFIQSLPRIKADDLQLASDLRLLYETPALDGLTKRPVAIWLENATRLASQRHRPEAKQLAELCLSAGGDPPLRSGPPFPPIPRGAFSLFLIVTLGLSALMVWHKWDDRVAKRADDAPPVPRPFAERSGPVVEAPLSTNSAGSIIAPDSASATPSTDPVMPPTTAPVSKAPTRPRAVRRPKRIAPPPVQPATIASEPTRRSGRAEQMGSHFRLMGAPELAVKTTVCLKAAADPALKGVRPSCSIQSNGRCARNDRAYTVKLTAPITWQYPCP